MSNGCLNHCQMKSAIYRENELVSYCPVAYLCMAVAVLGLRPVGIYMAYVKVSLAVRF